ACRRADGDLGLAVAVDVTDAGHGRACAVAERAEDPEASGAERIGVDRRRGLLTEDDVHESLGRIRIRARQERPGASDQDVSEATPVDFASSGDPPAKVALCCATDDLKAFVAQLTQPDGALRSAEHDLDDTRLVAVET